MKLMLSVILLASISGLCKSVQVQSENNDSYLLALKNSKDIDTLSSTAREDFQPSYYPDNSIGSSPISGTEYDSSSYHHQQYSHPKATYGPPHYEPSKPIYTSAPAIHQIYYGHSGPPPHYPTTAWSAPREENWFLNKLKLKLDFFTIGKILLKLIIFKKIVKFLALICLLLFLPKLQATSTAPDKEDDLLEERRQLDVKYNLNGRINEMTDFALSAMDSFSKKYPDSCAVPTDITCRLSKMIDAIDQKYSYAKVVQLYLPEGENQLKNNITNSD